MELKTTIQDTPIGQSDETQSATVFAALRSALTVRIEPTFVKDKSLKYVCCSRSFAAMAGVSDPELLVGKT